MQMNIWEFLKNRSEGVGPKNTGTKISRQEKGRTNMEGKRKNILNSCEIRKDCWTLKFKVTRPDQGVYELHAGRVHAIGVTKR